MAKELTVTFVFNDDDAAKIDPVLDDCPHVASEMADVLESHLDSKLGQYQTSTSFMRDTDKSPTFDPDNARQQIQELLGGKPDIDPACLLLAVGAALQNLSDSDMDALAKDMRQHGQVEHHANAYRRLVGALEDNK